MLDNCWWVAYVFFYHQLTLVKKSLTDTRQYFLESSKGVENDVTDFRLTKNMQSNSKNLPISDLRDHEDFLFE